MAYVNKLYAKDPMASHLIRCLAYFQALFDFRIRAVHISSHLNVGADDLSRDRAAAFLRAHPFVSPLSTQVSQDFLDLLLQKGPTGPLRSGSGYAAISGSRSSFIHKKDLCSGLELLLQVHQPLLYLPNPITIEKATLFVAFLGTQGLAVSTIESYLAALRHMLVMSNPSCTNRSFPLPHMTVLLRGIKRVQSQAGPRLIRLPITASLMRRIKAALAGQPSSYNNVLLWGACCTVFLDSSGVASFFFQMGCNSTNVTTYASVTSPSTQLLHRGLFPSVLGSVKPTNFGRAPLWFWEAQGLISARLQPLLTIYNFGVLALVPFFNCKMVNHCTGNCLPLKSNRCYTWRVLIHHCLMVIAFA